MGTQEESCVPWTDSKNQQIDLVFNVFFMVFFVIRVCHMNIKFIIKHSTNNTQQTFIQTLNKNIE